MTNELLWEKLETIAEFKGITRLLESKIICMVVVTVVVDKLPLSTRCKVCGMR